MSKPTPNWTMKQYREFRSTGVMPSDVALPPRGGGKTTLTAQVQIDQIPAPVASGMNKTETEYHHILANMLGNDELSDIFPHESLKVRIGVAGARCWYTPDFAVIRAGRLEFHEVKGGFVHDDARVKFESARAQYPQFGWVWAQKKQGTWKVK